MAISFDAGSRANGNTNSLSFSHTVGSGNNQIILVWAGCNPNQATISSVTYGGESLTYLCRGTGTYRRFELWYLKSPPTGANNVVISFSASTNVVGGAMSFNGVDDIDNCNGNYGNDASPSVSISSVSGDYWAAAAVMAYNKNISSDAGQTERFDLDSSNYATNGATDQDGSFSWTLDDSGAWAAVGARLVPSSEASGTATISGGGSLTASGEKSVSGSASISGGGSINANGYKPGAATGYKIEQSDDQGSNWTEIATVIGADIKDFLITGLDPNTRYDFRIRAYNAAGNSGYSNEAHATTDEIYTRTEFEKFMRNPNAKPVFLAEINPKMQLTGLSLVSGKTYTYEYEITDRGIDIKAVYENGVAYSEVSSITSVENSASTFYCDYYNRKLYIHTSDGTEPDNFYLEASFWLYFSSYQTKTGTIIYNGNYYFPYLDLENIPDISSEIKRLYEGNISLSSGDLVVRNARQGDGTFFFDRKFEKYIWRNRKVRLKAGKKDFSYTDFQTIYTGLIEGVVCEDKQMSFSLVDIREGIWRTLPINKFWQSNYPDLPDEEQGAPIPILFGSTQNARLVCIDLANKKYKFHDGRVKSVTEVRDKDGNVLTENTDYYVDLKNAIITFDRDNYTIGDDDYFVVDFEGIPDSAGNLIQSGAEIYKYIYNTYLELDNSELDLDSIYQTKYEKEKNLNLFMYLQKSSNTYIREIEHSLEAYSFQDEEGRIGLRTFGSTAPSDAKYIANHQIFDYSQEKKKKDILYKVNIFYNENPQNQSWEVKSFFSNPVKWGYHIYEDIDIYTRLTTESEVDTLGGNILGLLNKPTINFAVHNVLYGCSAGDIVRLTRNRYYNSDGSASEKPIRILEIDKSYSSGKTTIMAEEV